MALYRSGLTTALAPLLRNNDAELGIFNDYLQTHDAYKLTTLSQFAGRYRQAAALLSAMTVPLDARQYHLAVANSLLRFAATLDALVKNANDPMATLALLRSYNAAEDEVYASFAALTSYQKRKLS